MIISLIVAMDESRGIGLRNQVPWHIPADLKRFKALTLGHHLIVGRKTFESIGRALPGRTIIVVTRSKNYSAHGCLVVTSLAEALHLAEIRGENEVFIAGGGMIYAQALSSAERIYLTRVEVNGDADVFFPEWNEKEWQVVHQETPSHIEPGLPTYSFQIYERVVNG